MVHALAPRPAIVPPLDPRFEPAALFHRAYDALAREPSRSRAVSLVLLRPDGSGSELPLRVLSEEAAWTATLQHVERTLKFALWQRGASEVHIVGDRRLADALAERYAPTGARAFDVELLGTRVFGQPFRVLSAFSAVAASEPRMALGGNTNGCRIGFDLGGSDRKCAALVDGRVVHSEEVRWDPYFQADPEYHRAGLRDSVARARAALPRVDAIGGSTAGIVVGDELRVSSLLRGLAPEHEPQARRLFRDVLVSYGVPWRVLNDGSVTALAGSLEAGGGSVLGLALGTSLAAGYVDRHGRVVPWLDELAFAPIDLAPSAPADEWSGDRGVGVTALSQQGVRRFALSAGVAEAEHLAAPELLTLMQERLEREDPVARAVFETVGVELGYALLNFARFYELDRVLLLGRVTSGAAGELLRERAQAVLLAEEPVLAERLRFASPSERDKRHGQAAAAATLAPLAEDVDG